MTMHDTAGRAPVSTSPDLDLIWGASEIATFIGRTRRQAFRMLEEDELPARKVNGRWVASRQKLREFFEGAAA